LRLGASACPLAHLGCSFAVCEEPSDFSRKRVGIRGRNQNARLAGRYDIDGLRLFQYARALVANAARAGEVECRGEKE